MHVDKYNINWAAGDRARRRHTPPAEDTHRRTVVWRGLFALLHIHNRAPTYTTVPYYYSCTDYCNALQSSAVPPPLPLLRFTKLPHVLVHWLRGMRFDERHPGILQIRRRRDRHCRTPSPRSPEKPSATKVPRRAGGHRPLSLIHI